MSIVSKSELCNALWGELYSIEKDDKWVACAIERLMLDDFKWDVKEDKELWEEVKAVIPEEHPLYQKLYKHIDPDREVWDKDCMRDYGFYQAREEKDIKERLAEVKAIREQLYGNEMHICYYCKRVCEDGTIIKGGYIEGLGRIELTEPVWVCRECVELVSNREEERRKQK